MVPALSRRTIAIVCCLGVGLLLLFVWPTSPLSLTADEPEPATLSVDSFDRLETGCADDVATYASSKHGGGTYTQVAFLETGSEAANLSVRTERTSPVGADLTTFRVYIESTDQHRENTTCRMGVQYRVELTYDRETSGGLLSGDKGTRVLWLENGEYSGCSSTTSGSLDSECHGFVGEERPDRTWANATTG